MSLASVSAGNVIVSTIKKCEDDDSLIARVYDLAGKDGDVALKLFHPLASAQKTSLIEEGGAPLAIRNGAAEIPVGHNAIETVKLKPAME